MGVENFAIDTSSDVYSRMLPKEAVPHIESNATVRETIPNLTPNEQKEIGNYANLFSDWLERLLEKIDTERFIKTIKENLPPELAKEISWFLDRISAKDIANFITLIALTGILVVTWVAIVPAIWAISARIGAEAILIRIATTIVSKPNISSVVYGLIPGMKMAAPNQSIAFAMSEMRNILLYVVPALGAKAITPQKK